MQEKDIIPHISAFPRPYICITEIAVNFGVDIIEHESVEDASEYYDPEDASAIGELAPSSLLENLCDITHFESFRELLLVFYSIKQKKNC